MERVNTKFIPGCQNHNSLECPCDFLLEFQKDNQLQQIKILRFKNGVRRTTLQLYSLSLAELIMHFDMDDKGIVYRNDIEPDLVCEVITELSDNNSHTTVNPRISGLTQTLASTTKVRDLAEWTYQLARYVDIKYEEMVFGPSVCEIDKHWVETASDRKHRLPGRPESYYNGNYNKKTKTFSPHSLATIIRQRISYYNTIATKFHGRNMIAYSTDDMTPLKNSMLIAEFGVDNVLRNQKFTVVRTLVPKAFKLFEEMMDLKRFKNSEKFEYSEKLVRENLGKMNTSVGIVNCESKNTIYGQIRKTGKKLEHTPATVQTINEWFVSTARGERRCIDCNCVVRYKGEFFSGWSKPLKELDKLCYKCRAFFLPSHVQVVMARIGSGLRQKKERGRTRIGQTWLHGGAYNVAKIMNWDRKGMRWSKADIYKFDKHVQDWFLMLYTACQSYYMDYDNMTEENRLVAERLLEEMCANITAKVTCFPSGIWRILVGTMYSGGYETSNGDTWITNFAYSLYLAYEIQQNPQQAKYIRDCFSVGLLAIIAYGDDHLCCWPPGVPNLNHKRFAQFCSDYLGLHMREIEEYDFFITVVNPSTGEIIKAGPTFLKRSFIRNFDPELPPVLAWRPTHETLMKMLLNNHQVVAMAKISAIGMAYDTLGTNELSYNLLFAIYEYLHAADPRKPSEILKLYKDNPEFEAIRKTYTVLCGMNETQFDTSFPSYDHIRSMNILDPVKFNFVEDFRQLERMF